MPENKKVLNCDNRPTYDYLLENNILRQIV